MIYAGLSIKGKRERNEDCIYFSRTRDVSLVLVADGMGGHQAGLTASHTAADMVSESIAHDFYLEPVTLLKSASETANAAIYARAQMDANCYGMGTTLVMALLFSSRYYAANVGDSRLYQFNGSELWQVTRDHSYVAELVQAGYITEEEARFHPRRNIITRALGGVQPEPTDIFEEEWSEGDTLLLCSDGLYECLTNRDMIDILTASPTLQAACEALVERASLNGSTDNISVVLVQNREAGRDDG